MLRILIADDHPIVRKGLIEALSIDAEISVEDEAGSGPEAIEKLMEKDFDVVLLDISMPGKSGIETLKSIKNLNKKTPVLILSTHPEDQYALRALRSGASGYLTKDCEIEELLKAIHKVSLGGRYVSQALAEKLAFDVGIDSSKALHEALSDREYEVLCKIASGKTVSEIAEDIALSVKTISTYRARILEKMNMKNNAELTNYGIKNNLVD